jgi:hypothetical protein
MAIVRRSMWEGLTRSRRLSLAWVRQALPAAGELTLGIAAIGTWASGVGLVGGVAGVAGLAALGTRRAVVRRSVRIRQMEDVGDTEESEAAGEVARDLAAAAVYSLPPFLLFPTAGYLLGYGEIGMGLAALAASAVALLPPALLAKEGLIRIATRVRRSASRDEQEALSPEEALKGQITGVDAGNVIP